MSCEKKIKHLEMIEGIIDRMGNNSFQLKGWAITLISIIGALASQGSDKRFFFLVFIPLIAFWGLDAFYLHVERKYRELYKKICSKEENEIDFNMSTEEINLCYCDALFSKTELFFYASIAIAIVILAHILKVF